MRVIKLGGSLLSWSELADRLPRWYVEQPPRPTLIVVGGGKLADAFREAFRIYRLAEVDAHWLCVRAMHLNAELLHCLWPATLSLATIREAESLSPERPGLVDPWRFLHEQDALRTSNPLPASWAVTSDSIAARVAKNLAAELVLLKSTLPASGLSRDEAAHVGYVDEHFPRAAEGLEIVRCVNLRDANAAESRLD